MHKLIKWDEDVNLIAIIHAIILLKLRCQKMKVNAFEVVKTIFYKKYPLTIRQLHNLWSDLEPRYVYLKICWGRQAEV